MSQESLPEPGPRDEYCVVCGSRIPAYGVFCPSCGAVKASLRTETGQPTAPTPPYWVPARWPQVPARPPTPWRRMIKTGMAYGMLTFLAQMCIMLVALVYGMRIVLPEITDHSIELYVVTPYLIQVGTLSDDMLVIYYALLVGAILASALWLFASSGRRFFKELKMKAEPRKHSPLFDMCGLMFAVLFLNVVLVLVLGILADEPTTPVDEVETWELLFLLANASVWEELIVRVLMIGIPMIFVDLVRNSIQEKKYRYILGGGFSFGVPEVSLIVISSAVFGLGHYEGWGAWKVFPAAVAGVAFGYLYMKFGLASAIMLHFGFDYLSVPMEVFDSMSSVSALVLFGLGIILWVGLGAVFFGYYSIRIVEFVTRRRYFDDRSAPKPSPAPIAARPVYSSEHGGWSQVPDRQPEAPTQLPSRPEGLYVTSGFGPIFVCPACGYTEARWQNGRFLCLRCGKSI